MNIEKIPHKHEWFRTGEMKVGQMRCISCGTWAEEEMPKSEWIKLTNDEIEKCWKTAMKLDNGKGADITNQPFFHLARMVEYMLEEKNHG
jgi:hypothetical protein